MEVILASLTSTLCIRFELNLLKVCCKFLGVEVKNKRLKRQLVANTGVLTNANVHSFIDYIMHYITLTLYYFNYCDTVFLEAITPHRLL